MTKQGYLKKGTAIGISSPKFYPRLLEHTVYSNAAIVNYTVINIFQQGRLCKVLAASNAVLKTAILTSDGDKDSKSCKQEFGLHRIACTTVFAPCFPCSPVKSFASVSVSDTLSCNTRLLILQRDSQNIHF
jgi:hypothetical protein